jgi:LPS-assembly lipoprotein
MNVFIRAIVLLFLVASLAGCGFALRGTNNSMAFQNIYIQGNTLVISKSLKQSLTTSGVTVMESAEGADMQIEMVGEESEKRILSLAGTGTVNEFELYYRVHYRTKQTGASLWSPVQTVEARRDYTFSDANLLAKQSEEKRLNQNMQSDVVSNIMRRLAALKK